MLRRISDRARLEGMLALRKAIDSVHGRGLDLRPTELIRNALTERRNGDGATWVERAESGRPDELGEQQWLDAVDLVEEERNGVRHAPLRRDPELTKALDRIADSIDRVAAQLDSYHQERAEHLDAIEFLLREMVMASVAPSATRPIVLGGVIENDGAGRADDDTEISLLNDGSALPVDTPVEVRSRFHDRWICGFSIAEKVEAPGRRRYRLTRRSDGIPLPILFDACDVREATSTFDRQQSRG